MPENWEKIGHRGAPRAFPGNTIRSFQRAVELGCTMVECDVRRAADGVLVLAHDPDVSDRQGRRYRIAERSSADLRALDLGAGEGVPTLAELVAWAQGRCAVMADMKCEGDEVEAKVVQALTLLPYQAKIVAGAGEASRRRFRDLDPALPLSLSLGAADHYLLDDAEFARLLLTLDTEAVTWIYPMLTASRIAILHTRGLRVYAWTVDDLPTMRHLLDMDVDGIISNRADLLQLL
ncbi:MAG TPA: glycerophosphodiester phosphodiesterase [Chthonomonadaceae bacterium]|nr:glycerophosphodiester phosphodiesterase [Chthonomonadaceae bacterium]